MNSWTIAGGIIGALALIGGPIAALEFGDARWADKSLENIYLEDKVLSLEEECEETGDPVVCDRYERARAALCRTYPDSWLCD